MTTTEAPPTSEETNGDVRSTGDRPSSKELRALARRFKQGYRYKRTSGGHFRVLDRHGTPVLFRGKNLTVSGRPSPGSLRAHEEQLAEAQILQGTEARKPTDEAIENRKRANVERMRVLTGERQQIANARRERFDAIFSRMHGLDVPGLSSDLGAVAAIVARELPEGRRLKTPDLLQQNALRVLHGAWVESDYGQVWDRLVEKLEHAPDPIGEWYSLVREAKGLPLDNVEVRLPKGAEDDWPFRVELLPLDALLVDVLYQRPVGWSFVRREASRFDPTLVGTIDVSQRSPSSFAILDGQQRTEIVRLVGKSSIWCSIYVGMDVESEARMFLRKNRDRKSMHPYYTFRASMTAADEDAIAANAIVERYGYRLAIGAPSALTPSTQTNIAAISAVKSAYSRTLPDGTPALDPVLQVLSQSTLGREHGQDAMMIRGVAATFVARPELKRDVLVDVLAQLGPDLVLGRSRDVKRGSGISREEAIVRVLLMEHDKRITKRRAA